MTTTCSAPGKIYLFGEHAVVYGMRAIASAINLCTTATVAESDQTAITSSLGTTGIDYMVHPYISRCIESLAVPAVSVRIDSEIPGGLFLRYLIYPDCRARSSRLSERIHSPAGSRDVPTTRRL